MAKISRKQDSARRCARCNRALASGLGRTVIGYGVLGPECYDRLAALPHFLEERLPELAGGEAVLEMEPGGGEGLYAFPRAARELRERAERNHLRVGLEVLPPEAEGRAPRVRLTLRPGRPRELERALEGFGHEAWAEGRRRAALERQEAAGWGVGR